MPDPCIFMLDQNSQDDFLENDEAFSGAQLGRLIGGDDTQTYIVVNGMVAVRIAPGLQNDLAVFYAQTWGKFRQGGQDLPQLYDAWLNALPKLGSVGFEPISRSSLQHFAATGTFPPTPPPPPTRPTTAPGGPRPSGTASVHGHLPFQDVTTALDIFYRFEAWPSSRRVTVGAPGKIAGGTFASPSSELLFLPTGFAAVARNALPSFFPAVFRYELAPRAGARILCGAVVPMFGLSGGGVETMFLDQPTTANRGAIADPVIVDPL